MTNEQMAELLLKRAERIDATNAFGKSPDEVRWLSEEAESLRAGAQALRDIDNCRQTAASHESASKAYYETIQRNLSDGKKLIDQVQMAEKNLEFANETNRQALGQRDAAIREVERLRGAASRFIGCVLSVRSGNTSDWMNGIAEDINTFAEEIGEPDRCEHRGGHLIIIRAASTTPTTTDENKGTSAENACIAPHPTPDPRDARIAELEAALRFEGKWFADVLPTMDGREISGDTYTFDEVCELNNAYVTMFRDIERSIARIDAALAANKEGL